MGKPQMIEGKEIIEALSWVAWVGIGGLVGKALLSHVIG